jgi:hypothetical protein
MENMIRNTILKDLKTQSRKSIAEFDRTHPGMKLKRTYSKIYFIQSQSGEIKIGIANKVRKRLKVLQIGCPFKLKLLFSIRSKIINLTEKDLFRKFKPHRKRGEWFYPHQEILNFIEELKKK